MSRAAKPCYPCCSWLSRCGGQFHPDECLKSWDMRCAVWSAENQQLQYLLSPRPDGGKRIKKGKKEEKRLAGMFESGLLASKKKLVRLPPGCQEVAYR